MRINIRNAVLYLLIPIGVIMLTRYVVKHYGIFNNLISIMASNSIDINKSDPVLAVFSFQPEGTNRIIKSFAHYTVNINNLNSWNIKGDEITQISDSIPLMITVKTQAGKLTSIHLNNPLIDVVKGKYDYIIRQMCSNLIGIRPNVFLRFDPEMEVPSNRYPWQQYGGSTYIEAFRHFAEMCKTCTPQVKQVWGPAGYPGSMEYYPGDDVVDAASVTLKSESEMPLNIYPSNYTFSYDLYRRLHRLRFIGKPIFVLGSKQVSADSINSPVVSSITQRINEGRNSSYSRDNFSRPVLRIETNQHKDIEIGLYDPQSLLIEEKPVTVEHLFADFGNLHDGTFQSSFNKVVERGHHVIVTFEPFRNPDGKDDLEVLQHVVEGKYDQEISKFYTIISSTKSRVYLRYAHEMEIPIARYPWQSQDPVNYIKSYRYFMTFKVTKASTIKRIWGPAGDRGSLEWWPGNDVVDYVSIAIYGLPDKNITDPEKQETFSTIFNRKKWRLRFIDKPIFITEFGVKGPEDYQTKWLEEAAKGIRKNPQIIGVNYFNMSDTPNAWGEIKPPDWSITKKSFYHFLRSLNADYSCL